ncbi:MAG: DUF1361 domain-containing protein [Patescibacteria group bacterium]|nr:DUF1361 domain-containing protein [Patescibacteria group bacterium]
MNILLINAWWMTLNIILAVLPIFFALVSIKLKNKFFKYLLLFLWLVFVPNTFYIVTDVIHIPEQWGELNWPGRFILIIQYLILEIAGILTFILSLDFFEKALKSLDVKQKFIKGKILIVNFLIGFGIILGRFERINSWEPVTNPDKVINAIINTLSSPELIFLTIFFGAAGNLFYFLYKKKIIAFIGKFLTDVK